MSIDGILLTTFDGVDEAIWLQPDHLVLSTWQRRVDAGGWEVVYRPNGVPVSESFIGVTSSGELRQAGADLAGAISDNEGSLAVPRCGRCNPNAVVAQTTFAIWNQSSGETAESPGIPMRWSIDGSLLLIEQPVGDRPSDNPTESILSIPEMAPRFTVPDGSTAEPNATFRLVLSVTDGHASVIELATGDESTFGPVEDPLFWDSDEHLVALDYESKSATSFALDGARVAEYADVGDHVRSSFDGTTHVFWHFNQHEGPNPLVILRGGVLTRIETPGPVVGDPAVSNNGASLSVAVQSAVGGLDIYVTSL